MDADRHSHVCEACGAVFSHHKSKIKPGSGHHAHRCPVCNAHVNARVEIDPFACVLHDGVVEWYGHSPGADIFPQLDRSVP